MQVKVARIYLSENSPLLMSIYNYLHQNNIKGATIFRGVKGFGHSGKLREATIMGMYLSLSMIIEFCDEPSIVDNVLNHFREQLEPSRVLHWLADMCIG
ncbi:Uncharacterized ACR, COG1993 [Legionella busanensis]|uniref:Uncharacterized ACR, COG1993 n=1 Tax=Legionella busanensis TaxID=190655 RepID=A0A378JIP6_9GAMM|nr:DUF190 domain-containing protein [Legionella busanensis]STX50548.1 Uncharacterized ACR, COG1993 [Legionella busanensis]